ncbi:putative ribonuclease H-like domain-containing protein [Tanacetum coccineum]|uniref:Ribonuclease H-like domain-containing protein n=1 Tax=Tanacetum coccineum TaxID=301880 RepID=A0ABQ4YK12_9ASTR
MGSSLPSDRNTKLVDDDEDVGADADMNNLDAFIPQLAILTIPSFKDNCVVSRGVKRAFIYGKIEKEVYVCQPPGFKDPDFPDKVYKVEKALYGLHQALRAWYEVNLLVGQWVSKRKDRQDFIYQKRQSDVKTASTPMETHKPLLKDADGEDVDEHLYRSMIGSLMYLTSLRPDIMFGICACDLPFDLVAFTNNYYARSKLYRKIHNMSRQVLIGLNQLLIMGLTFMHTKIYIDNESTICIVKNPIFHSKTEAHRDYAALHQDSNEFQYLILIIHKGWLEWNVKAAKDGIEVKTGNSRVNAVGYYLVLLGEIAQQADMGEGSGQPTDPQHTSTSVQPSNEEPITVPSSSQPKKTHRPTKAKRATEISQSSRLIPCSGSVPDTILRGCNKLRLRRRSLDEKDASKPGRNLKQGKQSSIFEESDFDNEGFDADIDEVFKDVEGDVEQYTAEPITTSHVIITTSTITPPITTTVFEDDNLTIDQTLMKTRSEKSKVRGVVMQEPKKGPDQVDEEIAQRLQARMQAKLEEEERLAREREEDANIAEWDNAQAMMDADYELATRIQAQEQEELTIEEKSRLIPEVVKGSKDRAKGSETRAEGSSKRAGEDLQQESTKKQRLI